MRKCFMQGIIENLKKWIEIEGNSLFRNVYIDYYEMLEKKLER